LPSIINDLTFVVLSDIHVSGLIGRKRMKKWLLSKREKLQKRLN
jgi:predicted MPP superfamily phosphohydrolase